MPMIPIPRFRVLPALSLLLLAGCATSRKSAPEPIQSHPERVFDYRNGWFHTASGTESFAAIAEIYGRNAALVGELNRRAAGDIPEEGTPVYVPPINDRVAMREVLKWINVNPETVPVTPPPLDRLARSPAVLPSPDKLPERQTASAMPASMETEPPLSAEPAIRSAATRPGGFGWPVEGKIIRRFKLDRPDRFKGIAIATAENAAVRAARPGKVIYAGELKGYGQTVILDHGDGTSSVYGYASKLLVGADQEVQAGQSIATIGRPSTSSASQLFFQIRRSGRPVDPMGFLK